MKKTISIILVILVLTWAGFLFLHKKSNDKPISATQTASENNNTPNQDQDAKQTKRPNKLCEWIDNSDVIISLDLPEEYAHYNDRTSFPSYEVGFMYKSAYGDIAESVSIADKQCKYRVGFSKENLNNIHGRFFPIIRKGAHKYLTYENEPLMISLQEDGLPLQGKNIVLKVTGEVDVDNERYVKLLK